MPKIKIINDKTVDDLGTVKQIVYSGNMKKVYLFNKKNKTNFYTIIKDIYLESEGKYVLYSKLEVGEKYVSYFKYDLEGQIIYEKRYNKSKKTKNIRELFYQTNRGKIFLNDYNNEKTINFVTNKLKNGSKK